MGGDGGVKNYAFLFWAYNAVWLGLVVYLLWLAGRLRRATRRLHALERRLGVSEGGPQKSSGS